MKVTVWKNDGESNERCIARFNKKVQGSRKVLKIRTSRYNKKPLTKIKVREAAVMREFYRAKKSKNQFY